MSTFIAEAVPGPLDNTLNLDCEADMTERIPMKQLERMLLNIDVPDSEIRPYLVQSAEESTPLNPVVKVNPAKVETTPMEGALEGAVALASLNGIARWRRQQRYRRKVRTWAGLKIVSEGDSWFQYPFLLDDVIDNLFDDYAIFSLDSAGDLISDMVKQNELVSAVAQERPQLVLLSGGGNDILGGSRLSDMLPPYQKDRPAEAYLGKAFDSNLRRVLSDYEILIRRIVAIDRGIHIICHSYDHAIPAGGRWLGKPLAKIGITDPVLQRRLVQLIVDRFHAELVALTQRVANVRLVDCRGIVQSSRWHDELHPNNAGFKAVAGRFAQEIAAATGTSAVMPEMALEAGALRADVPEMAVLAPSLPEQADALLTTYSEPILLREIGRIKVLADAGDEAAGAPLQVSRTSVEETFPEQLDTGSRLADDALAAVSVALGNGGADGRFALAQTLRAQPVRAVVPVADVLSNYCGLPETATALLAALVAKRLLEEAPELGAPRSGMPPQHVS